jgi:hypothetical protein
VKRLLQFFISAGKWGIGLMTGGVAAYLVAAYEHIAGHSLPAFLWVTLGIALFMVGAFLAWNEQFNKVAASGSQLEHSQMPFLAVVMRPDPPNKGWGLENQGSGPAINGTWSYVQGGKHTHPVAALAPGARLDIHNAFAAVYGNQGGIQIQYESLSGVKYQTNITWGADGVMHTRFDKK